MSADENWICTGDDCSCPRHKPTAAVGPEPMPECRKPPHGWVCTRKRYHEGPCAAWPADAPEVTGEGWRLILTLFHEATTGCTMDELRSLLAAQGLALVPIADLPTPQERAVLRAMARLNDTELVTLARAGSNEQDIACAELARRAARGGATDADASRLETGDW